MQSAFRAIHPELEDASRILGATRLRALWQITAPLLRTCVIATWCFVFVGTIRELSAAIMLFTSETKVISVLIFDLNESGDLAAISVLGLIMLVVTFGDRRAGQPRCPASAAATSGCRERTDGRQLPDIAVAEHLADRIAALDAGKLPAAVREKCEEIADRRDRPLRRRAQRGLRPARARRLGRRRPLHRDRPRAHA